jgi:hypothetical protein
MTANTQTEDLSLARHLLMHDSFLDGHTGLDPQEYYEIPASEPGVISVHLNGEVVEALLFGRGWNRTPSGAWVAPDGNSKHWDRAEALTLALTAEVV